MLHVNGPSLALLFSALFAVTYRCFCLTADESLKPKESIITINHGEDSSSIELPMEHHIYKRNIISDGNITANVNRLNDSHQQLLVHWTGKKSNVFICLARNNWDHLIPNRPPVPSAVYISYDYGKTYENKTDLFKLDSNTSYSSVDKFYNHPRYQSFMVFIDRFNRMIFVTKDYGKVIRKLKPQFQPMEIAFYPDDPLIFLAYDVNKTLWITRDFGESFSVAQEFVKTYVWTDRWPGTWTDTPTRALLVQRIEPANQGSTLIALGNLVKSDEPNITVEMRNIEEFMKTGDFVFVTRKVTPTHYELYISYRGGDFFKAQFGSDHENGNFHIVDVSEVRVMVAVGHNETLCNLYISEVVPNSDYMFRLTLERLFCYFPNRMWKSSWLSDVTDETFADLHKVKGMRGIYLASQVTKDANSSNLNSEHLQTLITFDWGGEWKPIMPPTVNELGQPIVGCNRSCTLHLTQKFMNLNPFNKSVPILTSESAPGLIVATGVLGTSLKGPTGIFVSRDAGLTWKKVLRDSFMFNFGDHGGIMTAVKYFKSSETQKLLYSTDEGETWKVFKFIDGNIRVYNLMTEPGENTTVFTLFGSEVAKHGWMIITIDLKNAFRYNCTKEDYRLWSPSGGLKEKKKKSICIMGLQEVYERRIQHSNCYNGRDYERPVKKEACLCDIEDFECDFGFTRHVSSSGCIRNKSITTDPYRIPVSCRPGSFYKRTKGYRKIDGDACYGGFEWQYLPESIPCPFKETNHFLLVALKKEILRFNLAEPDPKPEVLPVRNLSNVIAIDFDMANNCLFYGDVDKDIIVRQCLSGKEPPEILVESGLKSVEGLAYDWIAKMLYFVDGFTIKIEAIRTDFNYSNRMRITIHDNSTLDKPRGIALHPVAGYVYWTDWSRLRPHVGRSNLNGSDVKLLFSTPDVYWPNGITVDHIAEQIYWVDAKLDYIAAADLHGRNFRKIITTENGKRNAHPFSVAVFKDIVYWDDWEKKMIFTADKDHGVGIHKLSGVLEGLMDLKVYAHSLQEGSNACSNSSSVCSHLCFAQPDKYPPVCACPDDMILKDGECRCFDGSKQFSNHTCPKKKQCLQSEFQCANNYSCIPRSWKCNGINDCGDNSDEIDCPYQTCQPDNFRCKNGHCIPKYWVCDSDPDCADGDDEINCSAKVCGKDQFQCKDSRCISQKWRCDGEFDCKDHSDEENCPKNTTKVVECTDKQFHCAGQVEVCIPESWVCDDVADCIDKSDEANCHKNQECDVSQFQCAKTKRCIYNLWLCDGDYDCGDGDTSDEANCTVTAIPTEKPDTFAPCKDFMFKCSDEKCIPEWWKCDKVPDCSDGSDEIGCPDNQYTTSTPIPSVPFSRKCRKNEFRCGTGDCIPSAWTCDKNVDCTDGSDEVDCKQLKADCPTGYLKCHSSNSCYRSSQACDGHFDCPDHSDEKDCANSASTGSPKIKCNPGLFACSQGMTCIVEWRRCDGHRDCFDNSDETDCEHYERVYQVKQINVGSRNIMPSSIPIFWSIEAPPNMKLEYLPSIAPITAGEQVLAEQKWTNLTKWLDEPRYTYTDLQPFTHYNLTVFVRVAGKPRVYTPAEYLTFITPEDIPSSPWNVTVTQKSNDIAVVRWNKPRRPNGIIREYFVYSTPPLPPTKTIVYPQKSTSPYALVSTYFEPGKQYSFWVVAGNSAGFSNNSAVVNVVSEQAKIGKIKEANIKCANNDISCKLTWKEAEGATGYRIHLSANPPYPKFKTIQVVGSTSHTFKNIAPGVLYKISINAYNKSFEGPMTVIPFTREGVELPVIQDIGTHIENKESGYVVTLSWKPPKSDHYKKEKWTYGIYYGIKASELFDGPKNETNNLNITIDKLQACETYLFDIGVVKPLGYGPLSTSPARLTTGYHRKAPPKGLIVSPDPKNETVMVISWNSSCFEMKEPIGYTVNICEVVKGHCASLALLPTNSTGIQHKVFTSYGARYHIFVKTSEPSSISTPTVEYWAPLLPTPHQVKVERLHNSTSYLIQWKLQETLQNMPRHEFEILVSEGEVFNESLATVHHAGYPPFYIKDIKPAAPYSVAIRLVSEEGYKSPLSEINNIRLLHPEASAMSDGGSMGVASVFLLVSVGVFFFLLVVILGVYFVKQYRVRNSFASFANSHYSTSSGATIFTDRLDDEEPVIRGFSDDEPLVVA